jgi:hypothetical protein
LGLAFAAVVLVSSGCEPAKSGSRGTHAGAAAAPSKPPTFASRQSEAVYARAVLGMRAIGALRGATMTESLAMDLGFKCADLEALRKNLEAEPDPQVWRLRTDIDKTCRFDVPLATGQFELSRILKKRAGDSTAAIDGECRALKLAIEDIGNGYLANPASSDLIDQELQVCETGDTVRRVP